ncbi:MAG: hypothetical protein ABSA47_10075 [Verrucomicrobiota bacterium]
MKHHILRNINHLHAIAASKSAFCAGKHYSFHLLLFSSQMEIQNFFFHNHLITNHLRVEWRLSE